jgi:peptide/nickel transport system ATP-binding protein
MPDPSNLPAGLRVCRPAVPYAAERCGQEQPQGKWVTDTHFVACLGYETPGFSIKGRRRG